MPTCCRAYSGPPSCCWHRTRTTLPRSPPAGSAPASATAGWAERREPSQPVLQRGARGPLHHLLHLGRPHQPQRRADSASEGGVRDELRADDADSVHLLQHLPGDVAAGGTRHPPPPLPTRPSPPADPRPPPAPSAPPRP